MMPAGTLLFVVLLVASIAAQGSELEQARDAVRRHQYDRAAGLLRAPAMAGDPEAAFMLAQLLRYGRGVAEDLPEACRLLEQSAGADHARAAASLAAMLDAGECSTSARAAQQWRDLAAEGGHKAAPVKDASRAAAATPSPEMLLRAARSGNLLEVRQLLGVLPVDVADDYGRTPLMLAAESGKPDVVRELLAHGAGYARTDQNGDTALLLATRAGSADSVELLLAAGAPTDSPNKSGITALMLAARAGATDLAEQLLAAGADVRLRDVNGLRAGDFAARAGHAKLAARLGVAAPTRPAGPAGTGALYAGRTPLMIAAERGDTTLIRACLAAGDDVNEKDQLGVSALAMAAAAGKAEAVAALLAAGATVDARDADGWTALGQALRAGKASTAIPLIDAGADARSPQGNGKTPLLLAVESRQANLVAPLIHAGAAVEASDADGMTLLMTAAAAGDEVSVSALLAAGARPMAIDKRGRTALWHAANQGALPAVRRLTGVSPLDAADAEGTTALATAAARGADAIVSVLLSAGADPGIASKSGNIPLHFASAAGHAQTVSLLASGTGNIDAVNRHRDTALILAVKSRCPECVRTLLAAGASARLRNSDSLTAADVARLTGDAALAALLD